MKIKDLIKQLREIEDKERDVILSSDAEGNSYAFLSDITLGSYDTEEGSTYNLEVGIDNLTEELEDNGFEKEDVYDGKCIILYPVN